MKKVLFLIAIVSIFSVCANATSDTSFVTVQVGASAKSSDLKVLDSITGQPISGATVSNLTIQNNNPGFASVSYTYMQGGVYSIKVTPVAQGSGTATINCLVSYTDAGDGLQKNENKKIVVAYTVYYNPPHGSSLALTFN